MKMLNLYFKLIVNGNRLEKMNKSKVVKLKGIFNRIIMILFILHQYQEILNRSLMVHKN